MSMVILHSRDIPRRFVINEHAKREVRDAFRAAKNGSPFDEQHYAEIRKARRGGRLVAEAYQWGWNRGSEVFQQLGEQPPQATGRQRLYLSKMARSLDKRDYIVREMTPTLRGCLEAGWVKGGQGKYSLTEDGWMQLRLAGMEVDDEHNGA